MDWLTAGLDLVRNGACFSWTALEIFDGDRDVAAVIALGIARDFQPPAESERQRPGGIEPGDRRQVADDVFDGDSPAAQRKKLDPARHCGPVRPRGGFSG